MGQLLFALCTECDCPRSQPSKRLFVLIPRAHDTAGDARATGYRCSIAGDLAAKALPALLLLGGARCTLDTLVVHILYMSTLLVLYGVGGMLMRYIRSGQRRGGK